MSNLKMVDKLGELDAEIKALEKRKKKLVAKIKERGVGEYEGELFEATCYEQTSTKMMVNKLKRHFGADWHKFLRKQLMVCVKVHRKGRKGRKGKS